MAESRYVISSFLNHLLLNHLQHFLRLQLQWCRQYYEHVLILDQDTPLEFAGLRPDILLDALVFFKLGEGVVVASAFPYQGVISHGKLDDSK